MSAKPATLPVWDSNKTNVTTPTGGEQTDGYAVNAVVSSGIFNFLFGWITSWVVYLADGIIQHSTRTLTIPAAAGLPDPFTGNWEYSATTMRWTEPGGTGGDRVVYPIILDVGERIVAIRAKIRDTNHAAGAVLMKLWDADATAATPTQVGATQTSNNDGTRKTLTLSGLTTTVALAHSYSIEITSGTSGGVSTNESISVEVDYDRVTS